MKIKLSFITFLALISIGLMGLDLFQSFIGPHKGTVKNAGAFHLIEFRNDGQEAYAYLLDKKLYPISNNGIVAEIKFIYPDSTHYVKPLKPFGSEGFSTEIGSTPFSSCRISFTVSGKVVSAKFENSNLIVERKRPH